MIVNERVRDYIHSLESSQGELCDQIARKAAAENIPIIEDSSIIEDIGSSKKAWGDSGSRNRRRLFCFTDGRCDARKLQDYYH